MSFATICKRPSAFLPVAMSLMACALVLGHIALFGIQREADEGAVAHFFQLLMAAQVPLVAYVGLRWLPREPRAALPLMAIQVLAALLALAPVFLLGL